MDTGIIYKKTCEGLTSDAGSGSESPQPSNLTRKSVLRYKSVFTISISLSAIVGFLVVAYTSTKTPRERRDSFAQIASPGEDMDVERVIIVRGPVRDVRAGEKFRIEERHFSGQIFYWPAKIVADYFEAEVHLGKPEDVGTLYELYPVIISDGVKFKIREPYPKPLEVVYRGPRTMLRRK